MEPVVFIENADEFAMVAEELRKAPYTAIDTESNSFYAYYERICLIQISTEERDYIIDPLSLKDLGPLGEILADPSIEKIFHAAQNDILGLKRDFGFTFSNLFDTAVACKLLGYNQLGLARILFEHFGITLDKKWQRHDWSRRPLKKEQIDYARLDTHYLIPLRHRLALALSEAGLFDTAKESSEKACDQQFQHRVFHPDAFIQIQGARSLDSTGKRILRALYQFREHEARKRNKAPFRILSNDTLLRLAHLRPTEPHEFYKIKGLPRTYHNDHSSHNLLEIIRKQTRRSEEFQVNN